LTHQLQFAILFVHEESVNHPGRKAEAIMRDLIGQQLGNYRLVRLLGRGGFAEVYLGQHVQITTQQAAIKVLYLTGVDPHKFRQEAQTIASLKHPNIIRLFDFSDQQDMPYLVMDYAPNGSLGTHHAAGERVSLATVVQYITQIANALQYAHDMHIIHRDIKPDNVLLGSHGELLLSDFGIAVLSKTGRATVNAPAGTAGTPYYMAPEMFKGKPENASDQYALAVMVYQWLSGTLPFSEGDFIQLGYQHTHEPVPPLRRKARLVSKGVEAVVMKALTKDPKKRFASVQAFATALEQASQSGQSQPSVNLREVTPLSQPEQNQLSAPPPVVTPPHQPLPSTVIDPSPKRTIELTIEAFSQDLSSRVSEVPDIQLPISELTGHPSRRAVIAGLVGLTLVGGGITWFTFSHQPIPLGTRLYTYRGHSGGLESVAWSPDGKRIASGSGDGTVQVWDAVDGGNGFTYKGHSGWVRSVAWSPDGKRIASGSGDGTVQVWDAVDGGNGFTYKGHFGVLESVAWSPDGKRIASGSGDKTVQVWDAVDGGNSFTYEGHSSWVNAVAWSPDGKRIASGSSDRTVQVWDAVDGGNGFTYKGHSDWVLAVAWSPDGKRIASGSSDRMVQIWDAVDGGNGFTYKGHSNSVLAVAWSPDGKRIASGGYDDTVQMWDAVDGENAFTYKGHTGVVEAVAWSPDGKRIASASWDRTVQVWVAS
jgi:WD40 repeat protein